MVAERNRVVSTTDPTAHAETMAIRTAAASWGSAALAGSTMYATFEPCPMCFGAILEAAVERLVVGARRRIGEPPLGDYTVEALAALTGRSAGITVVTGPSGSPVTQFYASVA
jgi:tRNA(adenine34) deaminase